MKNKLNWEGFSTNDRLIGIESIKDAISRNDGYILNFNMFSDLALSLSIELEENRITDLHKALKKVITVSEIDKGKLRPASQSAWLIFLNVSFGKGGGKLKTTAPAVQG